MKILVMIPTQNEHDYFLKGCLAQALNAQNSTIGRLPVVRFSELNLTLSRGGLGKVMFGVQTQHLLDSETAWDLVVCAGAAGGLAHNLSIGDIVVATETIEHDIRNKFGKPKMPIFKGNQNAIQALKKLDTKDAPFQLHFGAIASGDEDVVDLERQAEIQAKTGALAVAWEGAGGARACQFSEIPFVEIRGISDKANSEAPSDFENNLPGVMQNMAALITAVARQFNTIATD